MQKRFGDDGDPIVAVVIPAYNEARWIGQVLDTLPRDPRFESIVVDDGSDDGTAEKARAHGADVVLGWRQQRGAGAAIRAGWRCGIERGRPLLALIGGDYQHEGADLVPAPPRRGARGSDYQSRSGLARRVGARALRAFQGSAPPPRRRGSGHRALPRPADDVDPRPRVGMGSPDRPGHDARS